MKTFPISALIVDDEPIARRVLRDELALMADVDVVGEAENGEQALERISGLMPDLVFLDLQMPAMGGFEVIRELKGGRVPVIVIVTAFDEHAIRAFEAGAIDYLLKPVSEARLRKAVVRAQDLLGKPRLAAEHAERLSEVSRGGNAVGGRKIVGSKGKEYFLLDADEVLAFQADGDLVWIITARQKYLATQTLRQIEARVQHLPFHRVHRGAIVNVNHVRKMSALSSQRWLLTLSNALELIVSKRQAHNLRHILPL